MRISTLVLATAAACSASGLLNAQNVATSFTYQGLLADNGAPASGNYDLQFQVYDAATGGNTVGGLAELTGVAIAGGLVNEIIGFGQDASFYGGQARWLEVRVRRAGVGSYTALQPRQLLTPAPLASGLVMPFQRTVSTGNSTALRIENADSGTAIAGVVSLPNSVNPAVYGQGTSGWGVSGMSTDATGVNGHSTNADGVGGIADGTGNGVHGVSVLGDGVRGDGAVGVHGVNASNGPGVRGESSSGYGTVGESATGTGVVGITSSGAFGVYAFGNLGASGTKSFVEPHPTDPGKEIRYAALEGPEVGTYFRGTAHLENGVVDIEIPDTFKIVTDPDGITVQLTPIGGAANLYCVTRSLDGIEIAGEPDVWFDYQVNGVRKAFADFQPVAENTMYVPDSPDASLFLDSLPAESLQRMIGNGTLNADGSVNMETVHRLGWDRRPGWSDEPKRTKSGASAAGE